MSCVWAMLNAERLPLNRSDPRPMSRPPLSVNVFAIADRVDDEQAFAALDPIKNSIWALANAKDIRRTAKLLTHRRKRLGSQPPDAGIDLDRMPGWQSLQVTQRLVSDPD